MDRGQFIISILGLFLLNFYVVKFLDEWIRKNESVSDNNVELFVFCFFCIIWITTFPALWYVIRSRLRRRLRPLWWANLPIFGSLMSIFLLGCLLYLHLELGKEEAIEIIKSFGRELVIVVTFVPVTLGLVAAAGLIIECLRRDRPEAETKVFD